MEIIVLMNNLSEEKYLLAEHGLSFIIKDDNLKIIFDTGQTGNFIYNAINLKECVVDCNYAVISHGHYDHAGGLDSLLKINHEGKVIMKKEALYKKYSFKNEELKNLSFSLSYPLPEYENEFIFPEKNPVRLNERITVVPFINEYNDFENKETKYRVLKDNEIVRDTFNDELFLVIEKENKLNILTGCAHGGLINIIKTTFEVFGEKEINFIGGGIHMADKNEEYIEKIINEIKKFKIKKIGLNHCSGENFIERIKNETNIEVVKFLVGDKIII